MVPRDHVVDYTDMLNLELEGLLMCCEILFVYFQTFNARGHVFLAIIHILKNVLLLKKQEPLNIHNQFQQCTSGNAFMDQT